MHVVHSAGHKKLVLSPDMYVHHVVLPRITGTNLEVIVKLNPFSFLQLCILDLQTLLFLLSIMILQVSLTVNDTAFICSTSIAHKYWISLYLFLMDSKQHCLWLHFLTPVNLFVVTPVSHDILADTNKDSEEFLS